MAAYQEFIDFRTGSIFEFNIENTVVDIDYIFKDGPENVTDYVPSEFNFNYKVIKFTNKPGYAIIIQHWISAGMIMGCGECSLQKVNSIYFFDDTSFEDANRDMISFADNHILKHTTNADSIDIKENNFYSVVEAVELPVKVQEYFINELRKQGLIKIHVERVD